VGLGVNAQQKIHEVFWYLIVKYSQMLGVLGAYQYPGRIVIAAVWWLVYIHFNDGMGLLVCPCLIDSVISEESLPTLCLNFGFYKIYYMVFNMG